MTPERWELGDNEHSYKARKIKKLSLAEEAYNYLKEQIISGKIHQGDVITEQSVPTNCGFQEHRSKMQLTSSKVEILLRP